MGLNTSTVGYGIEPPIIVLAFADAEVDVALSRTTATSFQASNQEQSCMFKKR